MKRCPKCDFSFADFHHVCDFDGAPLLADPERPSSSLKNGSPRSRFRRVLKSTLFLDGMAVGALLTSALLIYYYHSPKESKSVATNQAAPNTFVSPGAPDEN